ncbi:MAG: hypothetical protein ACPGJR_12185 [Akkermansiaceae bacterium]
MKLFSILFCVVVFGLASCERHEWDSANEEGEGRKSTDTINLFLHEDHDGDHKDGKKPEGDH